MKGIIRKILRNIPLIKKNQTEARLIEIRDGISNQADLINQKMNELIGLTHQAIVQSKYTSSSINDGYQGPPCSAQENTKSTIPLMLAYKTYNTNHPEYDANLVRNFPCKIFNADKNLDRPLYAELKKMAKQDQIPDNAWTTIMEEALKEARTVPGADQVFERKAFIEQYIEKLKTKYDAFYNAGWVNLEDALFLYWVVRKLKPKTIVQTGVCNGLSSAFMMLALAKNGPEGTLHVIDMPPIFNPNDPAWTVKGKIYGVVIPEGKTSGWIVPDIYRDRFEVLNGDAKDLLPGLLKKVGSVDMFYHDSDHTYDHMIFEFIEAKKYLKTHGVMIADDIAWNSSLWDFADQYEAPAYNYRGTMGVACF